MAKENAWKKHLEDEYKEEKEREAQRRREREIKQKAESNNFVQDIVDFAFSNDIQTGDFRRISSFGKVIRDNKEAIVIIDFGLSSSVFSDYYSVS